MSNKLWAGRFSQKTDKLVELFTSSIDFDKRLYFYDIIGSIAHTKMLAKQKIINDDEAYVIINGLEKIKSDIESDNFIFRHDLEDIHMHIESKLVDDIGEVAKKLHTARSRNDQVILDTRMYLRDETLSIIKLLIDLRKVFIDLAKKYLNVILPGYTHMQRAQVVLLSHHFMAYYEMFTRDTSRFEDACKRINIMPLGSAALAGTSFPIDRKYTANLLNFENVSANSIDSVSSRDFIIEFLSCASICMTNLSRLSEELIIWSSSEFNFIDLPDAFTTGSSIMPQKKNPDVAELVRGKTGRVFGNLISILTLMKSLPLAYNRDMQEDKESLFDSVDTLKACVKIYTEMMPKISIHSDKMLQSASTGYLNATDVADYLVTKGIPFRQAHFISGNIVKYAINKGVEIDSLSFSEIRKFSDLIDTDIFNVISTDSMINSRKSYGGTATENVKEQISIAEKCIENQINELKNEM